MAVSPGSGITGAHDRGGRGVARQHHKGSYTESYIHRSKKDIRGVKTIMAATLVGFGPCPRRSRELRHERG